MSELKHWLDDASEADDFERAILRAGLEPDPPQTTQDQVWSSLMGTLTVAPLLAPDAAAASAKAAGAGISKASAVWIAVVKGFVVGLAVYGATAGVSEVSKRFSTPRAPAAGSVRVTTPERAPSTRAEPQSTTPTPTLTPAPVEVAIPRTLSRGTESTPTRPSTSRETNVLPSVAAFDDSEQPSSKRSSRLQDEVRMLRRAREELRAGKLADAFATLEATEHRFSAPALTQEREALMIELLYRSAQRPAAEERARAFLSRYPESPHAQQVRQFAR